MAFWIYIGIWYFVGLLGVLLSMYLYTLKGYPLTIGDLIAGVFAATLGPLAFILTAVQYNWFDIVVVNRQEED